jgi:23S rRNA A1618 N6-methylase RlmF
LNSVVDFDFNLALTRALLRKEFGVEYFEMPENHLVPPVPNRLSYVRWIEELLGSGDGEVVGLDVGTGASAIYPLLACASHETWKFLASEIDEESVANAVEIVKKNGLEDRITVVGVEAVGTGERRGPILQALAAAKKNDWEDPVDFVMTNPPFYANIEEASECRVDGRERTEMTSHESVTEGGEVGFVRRMLQDSMGLLTKVKQYTAMLSKRKSLSELIEILKTKGVGKACIQTIEFRHGQVVRFGLAWSFEDCVREWSGGEQNEGEKVNMRERVEQFFGGGLAEIESREHGETTTMNVKTETWEANVSVGDGSSRVRINLLQFQGQKGKGNFRETVEKMNGEIYRTNRKWRRKTKGQDKRKDG